MLMLLLIDCVCYPGLQSPWEEFVPTWELKAELNSLVVDWMQLAAYQKSLPFAPQPPQLKHTSGKYMISHYYVI